MAKLNSYNLTPGDKTRLLIIQEDIQKAIDTDSRSAQLVALMQAQQRLANVLMWFTIRDLE